MHVHQQQLLRAGAHQRQFKQGFYVYPSTWVFFFSFKHFSRRKLFTIAPTRNNHDPFTFHIPIVFRITVPRKEPVLHLFSFTAPKLPAKPYRWTVANKFCRYVHHLDCLPALQQPNRQVKPQQFNLNITLERGFHSNLTVTLLSLKLWIPCRYSYPWYTRARKCPLHFLEANHFVWIIDPPPLLPSNKGKEAFDNSLYDNTTIALLKLLSLPPVFSFSFCIWLIG